MGCNESKLITRIDKPLQIATLNYCGIMNSPFEFYCHELEKELKEISEIQVSLMKQYIPNFNKDNFKWEMGKIDQKMRTGRYSPLFSLNAGVKNNKFLTRQQFEKCWDSAFDQQLKRIKDLKCTPQQRSNTKLYDFIFYHALLRYIYKKEKFEELIQNDPKLYFQKIKPFYELSFLDQSKKLKKVEQNFESYNFDIFFMQEYSTFFQQFINRNAEEYYKINDQSKDTMIIFRKSSFNSISHAESLLSEKQISQLNWAERSAIAIVDNLIVICAHLSSKAEKNLPQIQGMIVTLLQIKKDHPNYEIIVAGDLNSFLTPSQQFSHYFQSFPSQESRLTTIKKRTMTQGQFHKGNKVVKESKDKLITSLALTNGQITYIDRSNPSQNDFIPSDKHPFDHYLVSATLTSK